MALKVIGGCSKQRRVAPKHPKSDIASETEKVAHSVGLVAVVYVYVSVLSWTPIASCSGSELVIANHAAPALSAKHFRVPLFC